MRSAASVDERLYRAAQYLYPPAFRREFSDEIVRVFQETRDEAQAGGDGSSLWTFRVRMGADLAATMVGQWLRSGWLVIVGASLLYPLVMASAIGALWRRAPFVLPRAASDADVIVLALLAAVALVLIAATIILTLWFTRPLLYRRRT